MKINTGYLTTSSAMDKCICVVDITLFMSRDKARVVPVYCSSSSQNTLDQVYARIDPVWCIGRVFVRRLILFAASFLFDICISIFI